MAQAIPYMATRRHHTGVPIARMRRGFCLMPSSERPKGELTIRQAIKNQMNRTDSA